MPVINLQTLIKAPAELCFDLSRSVNMHTQTMAQHHETAIDGTMDGILGLHETVTWKARHFGIYIKMKVEITELKPNLYFVDQMISGPFKWFRHYHGFETRNGNTLMVDEFAYRAPMGWLGRLADHWFLKKYMLRLLTQRNLLIKQVAEHAS